MGREANIVDVALDMHQILVEIEITPLQAQRLAAPQAEIVKHCQKQAMLMVLDGMQHVLGFLIGQRPTLGFFFALGRMMDTLGSHSMMPSAYALANSALSVPTANVIYDLLESAKE